MIEPRKSRRILVAAVPLMAAASISDRIVAASPSALRERGELATDGGVRDARMDHLALDVELASEHGRAYVEWTRREVDGVSPDDFAGDGRLDRSLNSVLWVQF